MQLKCYKEIRSLFNQYHTNNYNILFHSITTCIGLIMCMSLIPDLFMYCGLIYYISILYDEPIPYFNMNVCMLGFMFIVSRYSFITAYTNLIIACMCFVLQDFSNYITNEKVFMYQYVLEDKFTFKEKLNLWYNHSIYLVPLLIDSFLSNKVQSILYPKKQIIKTKLENNLDSCITELENEIYNLSISKENTGHWWVLDLNNKIRDLCKFLSCSKNIYDRIYDVYDKSLYSILEIPEMNEIYIATEKREYNADTVFFSKHINGPFGILPFIHVNRTLIAINKNNFVQTNFPVEKEKYILDRGDVVSFDFNREIHNIDLIEENCLEEYRILLKAHHLIFPSWMYLYALVYTRLNIWYNKIARPAFLKTLKPENKEEKRLVNIILGVTNNWYKIEEYIGFNNILYIGFLLFISYIMDNSLIYVLPIFIQHIINNNYENFTEENKQIKYNCIKDYVKKKDILSNTLERDIDIYKCLSYLNIIYILYYGMYTYIVIYFIMLYNASYIFNFVNHS